MTMTISVLKKNSLLTIKNNVKIIDTINTINKNFIIQPKENKTSFSSKHSIFISFFWAILTLIWFNKFIHDLKHFIQNIKRKQFYTYLEYLEYIAWLLGISLEFLLLLLNLLLLIEFIFSKFYIINFLFDFVIDFFFKYFDILNLHVRIQELSREVKKLSEDNFLCNIKLKEAEFTVSEFEHNVTKLYDHIKIALAKITKKGIFGNNILIQFFIKYLQFLSKILARFGVNGLDHSEELENEFFKILNDINDKS
jgi:hypothetical protein